MMLVAFASLVILGATEPAGPPLTFTEAVALARRNSLDEDRGIDRTLEGLGRRRLPDVRIEATGDTSRTLHPFTADPLESSVVSSILTATYPLYDGGAAEARIDAARAHLRRDGNGPLTDTRFAVLVAAFGDLHSAQRQAELLEPLLAGLTAEAERSVRLLEEGAITTLTAAQRQEIATSYASRMLELELRRGEAAERLRELTGLPEEPRPVLDGPPPPAGPRVDSAAAMIAESEARLRHARAAAGFQATLSTWVGAAAGRSDFQNLQSSGTFGVYGLRVHLSHPLFRPDSRIAVTEARADLELARTAADDARRAAGAQRGALARSARAAEKRLALLQTGVEQARLSEESMSRLVAAGLRTESELLYARAEHTRRRMDLVAAEVERWKAARLLDWLGDSGQTTQP